MAERRKTKRRSISYYMRIIDVDANELIGHLADISMQGLMMDSQKALPEGKKYKLRLNTTSDVADKDFIEFEARTKWCQLDPLDPGLFDVGFEIVSIKPRDGEIVQHIVDKYGSRDK
jgi:c-di-GMP-binding flagellar brake protein YcgR